MLKVFVLFVHRKLPKPAPDALEEEDIYAWCIVHCDKKQCNAEERITMLQSLGITKYAYDWQQHLPSMAEELKLAQKNKIQIPGVWLWIDGRDSIGKLQANSEKVFVYGICGYEGEIN